MSVSKLTRNSGIKDDFQHKAAQITSEMTLKEKVGQLFISMVHNSCLFDMNSFFFEETCMGNYILYNWANGNLDTVAEVKEITDKIRMRTRFKKVLPFIAVDQEGGKVERLKGEFTSFEINRKMANTKPIAAAFNMGKTIAKELTLAGINMNLAPVVDICEGSSWLAPRTFGSTPEVVTAYAREFIKGIHTKKVLTTLKHFPGHGAVKADSHYNVPVTKKKMDELKKCELVPYLQLAHETDCIMTAHIVFTEIDPVNVATLSKPILDMLEKTFNFSGLVISDSLAMKAVIKDPVSVDDAISKISDVALQSFVAGCDMMILSKCHFGSFVSSEEEDMKIIQGVLDRFSQKIQNIDGGINRLNRVVRKIIYTKLSRL